MKAIATISSDPLLQSHLKRLDQNKDNHLNTKEVDANGDGCLDITPFTEKWGLDQLKQVQHALFNAKLLGHDQDHKCFTTFQLSDIPADELARVTKRTPVDRAKTILTSPFFYQTFQRLKQSVGIDRARQPFFEVYMLMNKPENKLKESLQKFEQTPYQDYLTTLRSYGLNPVNHFDRTDRIYHYAPALQRVRDPSFGKAYQILKKHFPDRDFTVEQTDRVIMAVTHKAKKTMSQMIQDASFEFNIAKLSWNTHFLRLFYGVEVDRPRDLVTYQKDIDILRSDKCRQMWQYYQKHYPLDYQTETALLSSVGGFVDRYYKVFARLRITPQRLDEIAQKFGSNLGDLKMDSLYWNLEDAVVLAGSALDSDDFQNYVDRLVQAQPEIRDSLNLNLLLTIVDLYRHQDEMQKINQAIRRLQPDWPHLELDVSWTDEKIALLDAIKKAGMDKMVLTPFEKTRNMPFPGVDWEFSSTEEADQILALFDDGQAQTLYQSLTENWQLRQIGWPTFVRILNQEKKYRFFTNPTHAQQYNAIAESYNLTYVKGEFSEDIEKLDTLYLYAEDIVEAYDFLTQRLTPAIAQTYLDRQIGHNDLIRMTSDLRMLASPDVTAIQDCLKEEYGFSTTDLSRVLIFDIPLVLLQNGEFKTFYQKVLDLFKKDKYPQQNPASVLYHATLLWETAGPVMQALTVLYELKFGPMHAIDNLHRLVFAHPELTQTLADPNFKIFYQAIGVKAWDQKVAGLVQTIEAYQVYPDKDRLLQVIRSGKMAEVNDVLNRHFGMTSQDISLLEPKLALAEQFDHAKIEDLIARLKDDHRLTANDLTTLAYVAQNPEVENLLFDRPRLITALQPIYQRPASERYDPRRRSLEASIKKLDISGFDDSEAKETLANLPPYTERPDLNKLPTLELLRIKLIDDLLQKPETLARLGELASQDIQDKTSEVAGALTVEGQKFVWKKNLSQSQYDGKHIGVKNANFMNEIISFHYHARKVDESDKTGASGFLGSTGGDANDAAKFSNSNIVITTKGYPQDEDGDDITDQLIVNIDFYFVDDRNPVAKEFYQVDLGDFVVPYDS